MNFLLDFANSIKKSAREIKEEFPEKFVGKKSIEVLSQNVFSLANKDKAFRGKKWHKKAQTILGEISILSKENPKKKEYVRLQNRLQTVISGQEI